MVNQDKLEQWKDLIRLQEGSGLSPTTWCNQNKIKRSNYYYWKQKIAKELNVKTSIETSKPVIFIELEKCEPEEEALPDTKLHLVWRDLQIDVSSSEEISLAVELIKHLQQIC